MTTEKEIRDLVALLGGECKIGDDVRITGIRGFGPYPMPLIQAAERLREAVSNQAGAAVLGFRGAIRCCRAIGLDEDRVYRLIRDDPTTNQP